MSIEETMAGLKAYDMYPQVHPPADSLLAELAELERQVGLPFPQPYRDFVLKFGQYGFDHRICCPSGEGSPCGPRFRVSLWYGLRPAKANTLRKALKMYRARIPEHMIPVACDPGGNLLLLSLGGDDVEHVYSWDHEFRALGWDNLQKWTARLEDEGVDVGGALAPAIIREFEKRHPEELKWRPGYGNLYLSSPNWDGLIASLREYPE